MQLSQLWSEKERCEDHKKGQRHVTFLALRMEERDHEPRNVDTSRS